MLLRSFGYAFEGVAYILRTQRNARIELAVSLASPERHPSAKAAKDVAAASVLLGAVVSVVVGLLLFASRILAKLSGG